MNSLNGMSGCVRRFRELSAPVAGVLLVTGCFHYVPSEIPPAPKAATEVRVTLATPIDIPMGDFTLNEVSMIEGIVSEVNGDTLGLVAKWLYPRMGRKWDALYGSYDVPFGEIQQLEEWRLAPRRTLLFTVGAVAGATLLISWVWRVVVGGSGADGPIVEPS